MKTKFSILIAALLLALVPARAALNDWVPLSVQEQAASGYNYQGVFDATNFVNLTTNAASGTANTLFPRPGAPSINFPAFTRVNEVAVRVTTPFATSSGATAVLLSLGDYAVTNRFLSGVAIGPNTTSGTWYVGSGTNYLYTVATNLQLHLQVTGGAASGLNAGRIEVYLNALPLNNIKL